MSLREHSTEVLRNYTMTMICKWRTWTTALTVDWGQYDHLHVFFSYASLQELLNDCPWSFTKSSQWRPSAKVSIECADIEQCNHRWTILLTFDGETMSLFSWTHLHHSRTGCLCLRVGHRLQWLWDEKAKWRYGVVLLKYFVPQRRQQWTRHYSRQACAGENNDNKVLESNL